MAPRQPVLRPLERPSHHCLLLYFFHTVGVSRCLGWLTLGIAFNEGIAYSNQLEIYDEYDDWIAEAREKRDSALANLL